MFLKPEEVYFKEVEDFKDMALRGVKDFGSTNKWFYFLA